jgi:hypothetical protein
MCQDHPKWGNSMTCHNFDHRITPKGQFYGLFWNLSILAQKFQKSSQTGWLIFIELPLNEQFYENASGGTLPIWGIFGAILWTPKFHNTNYMVIESPQKGKFYALAQKG